MIGGKVLSFRFQPVKDIYLNLDQIHDGLDHGDIRYIWLFGLVAAFILLIAAVNFINLSTAKSSNRAREVGIRKVAGSQRNSLVTQFLTKNLSCLQFFLLSLDLVLLQCCSLIFNVLLAKKSDFPMARMVDSAGVTFHNIGNRNPGWCSIQHCICHHSNRYKC